MVVCCRMVECGTSEVSVLRKMVLYVMSLGSKLISERRGILILILFNSYLHIHVAPSLGRVISRTFNAAFFACVSDSPPSAGLFLRWGSRKLRCWHLSINTDFDLLSAEFSRENSTLCKTLTIGRVWYYWGKTYVLACVPRPVGWGP